MSIFNKIIIYSCLLIFFNFGILKCSQKKEIIIPNKYVDCKFEGCFFVVNDTLYTEKTICFFSNNSCPTCILEVLKYSQAIYSCPKVLFFTNKIDTVNLSFYSILNPKVFNFNDCWTKTNTPILFQTDKSGKIYNLLKINYNEPYLVKEYLLRLNEGQQ